MSIDQDVIKLVQERTGLSTSSVSNTIQLLSDGATIPFISRYRKEQTGSLDEVQVENISKTFQQILELILRKDYIIKTIKELDKLSPTLQKTIMDCWDSSLLEDLYLPFKRKQQTKAGVARTAGLEPLAEIIFKNRSHNLRQTVKQYLNKQILTIEDALAGARDIIAENISEHKVAREITREIFQKTAIITSSLIKSKEKEAENYKNYFALSQPLSRIPSHRLLAMNRGESEKLLRIKIEIDEEKINNRLERYFIRHENECSEQVQIAIKDCLKRLLIPSISNEFRKIAKDAADDDAIAVFSENLKQLLLAPPLGQKPVLAIDPGFRTGCKLAVLDDQGGFITHSTIFPHPPINKADEARHKIEVLLNEHKINCISIGNGTAGRETMDWINKWISKDIEIYLVNENGASIYSASEVARVEFPDLDLTIRGSISIGRRLMDPLAELVKIEPKSIGVGQYQHDVNQVKLKEKLDQTVINAVNKVGINVNTASTHLLNYVSGLGPTLAQNIVDYRQEHNGIHTRKELLNVPRMGLKSYEQSAGFLRIKSSKNPLDDTGVHPESYDLVERMAMDIGYNIKDLLGQIKLIDTIKVENYVSESIGIPTLNDIIGELKKPGLDPRGSAKKTEFTLGLKDINDIIIGMKVIGIVNNMTKFGAFIDIGIKENGLIHISKITDTYISDPSDILKIGQEVEAIVTELDVERKRISLSMRDI